MFSISPQVYNSCNGYKGELLRAMVEVVLLWLIFLVGAGWVEVEWMGDVTWRVEVE